MRSGAGRIKRCDPERRTRYADVRGVADGRALGMAEIETGRLWLRPLCKGDAAHFARLFSGDWEAVKHTGRMPFPPTERAMREWIGQHLQSGAHGFLVIRKADVSAMGAAGFGGDQRTAELGYALGRRFWGQGFATEAVVALVEHARRLGLFELEAFSFVENPASGRVLEKAGFEDLGIIDRDYPARGGARAVRHFRKFLKGGP
jgi:RimJ/RimL family protein N-acetyltransferase